MVLFTNEQEDFPTHTLFYEVFMTNRLLYFAFGSPLTTKRIKIFGLSRKLNISETALSECDYPHKHEKGTLF